MAVKIANGSGQLTISDLVTIADSIDFSSFSPDFLPPISLADNSVKKSKYAGLKYVAKLWGISSEELVRLETSWLAEVRNSVGASKDDEKDVPEDLITPQILTRVISVAYFIYKIQQGLITVSVDDSVYLVKEAVAGLNLFMENPVIKGRMRKTIVTVDGKSVNSYNFITASGVHAGGYGKFLPFPEKSLPFIFAHFQKDAILKDAYR